MRNEELDDLMGRLEERDATIERLETLLQEKEDHIADLLHQVNDLTRENADLWRRI